MPEVNNELRRIAVFVEGLTEQMFVTRLFEEVLTSSKLAVVNTKMSGGASVPINIQVLSAEVENDHTEYYVLIVDCSGDSTVKSYILDQRQSLIAKGYEVILGLLDLFPHDIADFHKKLYGLMYKVPQTPIPIEFTLSIAEIESWFIGEHTHFERIHPSLNCQLIDDNIGYNPQTKNVEEIVQPSLDLNEIYQLVGENYVKNRNSLQATIDALDYGDVFYELPQRIPSLKNFIESIDRAVS